MVFCIKHGKILDGMKTEKINELLHGNLCGRRPTFCADQLPIAVMGA
ncbi:MAG: TSCPD domain-containing protein [Spirochaetales bacterium]|nr:TSCPD domain-containing protein [Spirochaetales bacterium]